MTKHQPVAPWKDRLRFPLKPKADANPVAHAIHFNEHSPRGPMTYCLCGWSKAHPRAKVRDTAGQRHLAKKAARR